MNLFAGETRIPTRREFRDLRRRRFCVSNADIRQREEEEEDIEELRLGRPDVREWRVALTGEGREAVFEILGIPEGEGVDWDGDEESEGDSEEWSDVDSEECSDGGNESREGTDAASASSEESGVRGSGAVIDFSEDESEQEDDISL